VSTLTATQATRVPVTGRASRLRVFAALIVRDALVTRRELGTLIAQGVMMPFLLLFVFGRVIASMGFATGDYARVLFPGLIAMVTFAAALQSSAAPLVIDFATGREIEDRLLAPVPHGLVAVEKVVFAALRAIFCAVLMVPVGALVLGGIPFRAAGLPLALLATVLGALVAAAFGIALGTVLPPNRISMMYSVVLMPLMFTGSAQYPFLLVHDLLWFQVISAINPMTYFSESMRAAFVPSVPHLNPWLSTGVLVAQLALLGGVAIRSFRRRAVA
jgi:ABC-2 type transport system permease protein